MRRKLRWIFSGTICIICLIGAKASGQFSNKAVTLLNDISPFTITSDSSIKNITASATFPIIPAIETYYVARPDSCKYISTGRTLVAIKVNQISADIDFAASTFLSQVIPKIYISILC